MNNSKKINVVCFGGGTGLPSLLSGLKNNPRLNITAIVNMFDTGGSSGELRDRFGILPPGDVLKCLLALSEDEVFARKLLLKRISHESVPGHTGGNILLMGMERVYGNYIDAVGALGQILSVTGVVAPVTLDQSTICAEYKDGTVYRGETSIDRGIYEGHEIKSLFLDPAVPASGGAIKAIKSADIFCVGPGSFYTSIMPNFLPQGIKTAIVESKAPIIFIANLLTEGLGMKGYTLKKLVAIIQEYAGRNINVAIVNHKLPDKETLKRYEAERKYPILSDEKEEAGSYKIFSDDLWIDTSIARHDSVRLASLVFGVMNELI